MRIHLIAGFIALVSQNAVAQDLTRQQQIDQAKSVLQMACLSGTSYEFNATADGKIELKSLSPGGRGGVNANVKTAPGGVGYVQEEIRKSVDEGIRKCMEPYINRIFDIITGKQSSSNVDELSQIVRLIERRETPISYETTKADLTRIAGNIQFEHAELAGGIWLISGPLRNTILDSYGSSIHIPPNHDVARWFLFSGALFVGVSYHLDSYHKSECAFLLLTSWRQVQSKFNLLQTRIYNTAPDPRKDQGYEDSFELNMTKLFYKGWKSDSGGIPEIAPCGERLTLIRR